MFFVLSALAAPTIEVGPLDGDLRVTVELEQGWVLSNDDRDAVTRLSVEGKDASLKIFSAGLEARVSAAILGYAGGVDRVIVEGHFKACRKDSGLCRPFVVRGSAEASELPGRIVAADHPEPAPFLEAVDAHLRGAEQPKPAVPSHPAYVAALAANAVEALRAAKQRAAERKVPLLVVVGFNGCSPCAQLAEEILLSPHDPAGVAALEWVLLNRFDPGLAAQVKAWDATAAPTVLLLDGDTVRARTLGYRDVEGFRTWLAQASRG